jgi:hypothetical protein
VQKEPFAPQQNFKVYLYRMEESDGGLMVSNPEKLEVDYQEGSRVRFSLDIDSGGNNVLTPEKNVGVMHLPGLVRKALAGEDKSLRAIDPTLEAPIRRPQLYQFQLAPSAPTVTKVPLSGEALATLHQERSSISQKLLAIQVLERMTAPQLAKALLEQVLDEPFVLTLADLTRHSAKKLAYKAKRIVERTDMSAALVDILAGYAEEAAATRTENATALIARLEPALAMNVIGELTTAGVEHGFVQEVALLAKSRAGTRILHATASASGDRYYVRANWRRDDTATVSCLTKLFSEALLGDRSLAEERKLMDNRSSRLVYWYSKSWALSMADNIVDCGAKFSFVRWN